MPAVHGNSSQHVTNLLPYDLTRALGEEELLPADAACPFCHSDNRKHVGILQHEPEVELLQCERCGGASASRFPTQETLNAYYDAEFFPSVGTSSAHEQVTFENTRRFGRHLAGRLLRHVDEEALHLLDFGGSDGTLCVRVAEEMIAKGRRSVDVTVIDYEQTLTEPDDDRIRVFRHAHLDRLEPLSRFHLVVASAVLEHVPAPRPLISQLLNLVSTHGLFYARTPYVTPFVRLFDRIGTKWDFFFPAHVHDLGQRFWEILFSGDVTQGDFEILESCPSIVETSLRSHPLTTIAAHIFKAPWYLFRSPAYGLVGGWEIFVRRTSDQLFSFEDASGVSDVARNFPPGPGSEEVPGPMKKPG